MQSLESDLRAFKMNISSNAILIKDNKVLIGKRPKTKKVYKHYFFIVTKWKGEIKKENLNEIKVFKWITKDELNKFKFSRGLEEILKKALK